MLGLGTAACGSTPTVTPAASRTVTRSPTVPPSPSALISTPTVTPTRLPLSLFSGFVDTGCAWGIPLNQLLDCLSKFTGSSLRSTDGSYTASRSFFQAKDGRAYEMNVLDQSGRIIRNIEGTTYWDLSVLTPTPAATLQPTPSPTSTLVPQATVGLLRFYGFEASEIRFITETLGWVNRVDPKVYASRTVVGVSVYRVEPGFLSSVAAVSGLSYTGANRSEDMLTAFEADRINIRSDYMRAAVEGTKGATRESNQISFFALLAHQLQHVQDYRAYRAAGHLFSSCQQITPQQERAFGIAGFRAQLQVVEGLAASALAKAFVAPEDRPADRDVKIKLFQEETQQWVADLRLAVQDPEKYSAYCYPPTPTPIPTPTLIPPTPTIPPGMGVLVVVNPWGASVITINGPLYQVPAVGEITINLPPGRHAYTVRVGVRYSTTGIVEIEAGKYTRFYLPQPPPPEPTPRP